MENCYYPFENLPLPYSYNALEPFIDERTMILHHDRHLQAYINKLNEVLGEHSHLQRYSLEQLIFNASRLPNELQTAVRNNAGGVYNHRFFFEGMAPAKSEPCGQLLSAIEKQYGSTDEFYRQFKEAAVSVFGSGYAWLVKSRGCLKIITTANQNSVAGGSLKPILTLDVWEHAYYLKHYNLRADYIDDWFNVINWEFAENNFNH